jgi:hypothetical protein
MTTDIRNKEYCSDIRMISEKFTHQEYITGDKKEQDEETVITNQQEQDNDAQKEKTLRRGVRYDYGFFKKGTSWNDDCPHVFIGDCQHVFCGGTADRIVYYRGIHQCGVSGDPWSSAGMSGDTASF